MPFAIIGRAGAGLGHVAYWGLAICQREGVLWGANLGRTIVTNGDFTASVCARASTVGAAIWGGACGGPRHCCVRWEST